MIQNADFLQDFVEEATVHVETVEEGLLRLEQGLGDADLIHSIFRSVHSVKGTAGFFALRQIVDLAHAMESLLGEVRCGNLVIDPSMISILLGANDCLKTMVTAVDSSYTVDITTHTANINLYLNPATASPALAAEVDVLCQDTAALLRDLLTTGSSAAVLAAAIDRGHYLYQVAVAAADSLPSLLERLMSFCQVVATANASMISEGLDADLCLDKNAALLVTSVLEQDLLAQALGVAEQGIFRLDYQQTAPPVEVLFPDEPASSDELPEITNPTTDREMTGIRKLQGMAGETIRVHTSLLNDLLNLASELVLGRNRLVRLLEVQRKAEPDLNAVLQNLDSVTTQLQEKVMQTRMQPVAMVFNRFPRIMRELAFKMRKEIELRVAGTEVELDKSIIEALADPLTHLIRNAADHGIELPAIREKMGKPPVGVVMLKAYHEGGRVIIDVSDDGAGINVESVKQKAIQSGLINPVEANRLDERELLELLLQPGFSTVDQITDVSGRGVGMDVVKTNIEKLGGAMEISTCPGKGTTIRLALPLTLAIISALIVEVAGQKLALPQANLHGMVRIKPDDHNRRLEKLHGADVLRLGGRLLPVIKLEAVLGIKQKRSRNGEVIQVLVIKNGYKRFGLVVDCIHDSEEILVKPLPRYLGECQCYSGVTIMGDGRVTQILDPEGIANRGSLRFTDENSQLAFQEVAAAGQNPAVRQNLLLFRCSGPEIFGVDLAGVARVEKIMANSIEAIGDQEFLQYRGEALRLLRPESYLPVTNRQTCKQNLFLIIPKYVLPPVGILVQEILDTIESDAGFATDRINASGFLGSTILQGRIVLLLDLAAIASLSGQQPPPAVGYAQEASGRTVLLVEDTPLFAKLEQEYLEAEGYRVVTAVNGQEAWEILQDSLVDIVVSDIEMPVMDGMELIRRIRADRRLASLPVIAVTSRDDEASVRKGLAAGFDLYEIKLDRDSLLTKVRQAMQMRRDGESAARC